MLRTGDLQMLNMQMAVLHSPLVQYCVQTGLKVTPTVLPFGNEQPHIGSTVLLLPQVMQLFAISILPLGSSAEWRRREGKKKNNSTLVGWDIKRLSPQGETSWSSTD